MDFFEQQDIARRNTSKLGILFALTLIFLVAILYFALQATHVYGSETQLEQQAKGWWNPALLAFVVGGVTVVVFASASYRTLSLRQGGGAVATMLGGQLLSPSPSDPLEVRYQNVVEEMAIASGTPVPQIFVLPNESGINAFAAGHHVHDAAIAVTRGALEKLSRDELQGVVAHEFSHILNGDMRLNTRLIGLVFGILVLAIAGRMLLRWGYLSGGSSRDRNGSPILIAGIVLAVVGSIGVFFGKLIKSAISREREFLADAAAVQFTRNPAGLAGALKKVAGVGSKLTSPNAEEASHLFFGDGVGSWFSLMATHPPIEVRIKRIDPSFDGSSMPPPAEVMDRTQRTMPPSVPTASLAGFSGAVPPPLSLATARGSIGNAGTMGNGNLVAARQIVASLPPELVRAAHDPSGAEALMIAMLLAPSGRARSEQLAEISKTDSKAVYDELQQILPLMDALNSGQKLTLAELAVQALRCLSSNQAAELVREVDRLIADDGQIHLFEFALRRMIRRHIDGAHGRHSPPATRYRRMEDVKDDIHIILSALAYVGGGGETAKVQEAYQAGLKQLNTALPAEIAGVADCTLERIDLALEHLAAAVPGIKKNVLYAGAHVIAKDGEVTCEENELIRAVADSLECPLPPLALGV